MSGVQRAKSRQFIWFRIPCNQSDIFIFTVHKTKIFRVHAMAIFVGNTLIHSSDCRFRMAKCAVIWPRFSDVRGRRENKQSKVQSKSWWTPRLRVNKSIESRNLS